MNKWHRVTSLLVALAICLGASACGNWAEKDRAKGRTPVEGGAHHDPKALNPSPYPSKDDRTFRFRIQVIQYSPEDFDQFDTYFFDYHFGTRGSTDNEWDLGDMSKEDRVSAGEVVSLHVNKPRAMYATNITQCYIAFEPEHGPLVVRAYAHFQSAGVCDLHWQVRPDEATYRIPGG